MNYSATQGVQGICPSGWHLPTDAEWTTLATYLGGVSVAGGKMKSIGTIEAGTGLWNSPNSGATNSSGFSALPGGNFFGGQFGYQGLIGRWWSSTVNTTYPGYPDYAWSWYTYYINGAAGQDIMSMDYGHSVRCVKD
jgi:uncharacterized protein (TIGR02145 family)